MISYRVPSPGKDSRSREVQRVVVLILSTSLSPGEAWFVAHKKTDLTLTRNNHTLRLKIIIQRLRSVLSAKSASLHSAKRQLVIPVVQRVHPHVSGLKLIDRGFDVVQVLGPDRRPQSVDRSVRAFNSLVETAHPEDRQHRSESLFTHCARVIRNVDKNRGQI